MIAAETVAPKSKLKIKFGNQRIEVATGPRISVVNAAEQSKKVLSTPCAKKRGPPGFMESERDKRQKMERGMTQQCSAVLKMLMSHKNGWVFNHPVDPVVLRIPDYFSIITKPMDLGTIKSKLQKNLYFGSEEFAADVRLTFSNAMHYNPPENDVHMMAKTLSNTFEMKWKSLTEKWTHGKVKGAQNTTVSVRPVEVCDIRQNCPRTPICGSMLPKKSNTPDEQVVRTSDVQPSEAVKKFSHNISEEASYKDPVSPGRPVNPKLVLSLDTSNCGTCHGTTCQCSLPSDSTHASSEVTSDRSCGKDNIVTSVEASLPDCQAKSTSSCQTSKSDQESDGAVSALVDGNNCPGSRLSASVDSAPGEGLSTTKLNMPLSPRALRAASIKWRFADTIWKAKQKTLFDNSDAADPVKMRQERERLERQQREEKARIEAQMIAARLREKEELKKQEEELKRQKEELKRQEQEQREKEREAARVALQKMEKTVEFEQNLKIFEELELLCGSCVDGKDGSHILNQLGLFRKDGFLVEEEDGDTDLDADGEEGEIIS